MQMITVWLKLLKSSVSVAKPSTTISNGLKKILEDYEMKLHMYSDYIVRSEIFDAIMEKYPEDRFLQEKISILSSIDNRD